MRRVVRNDEQGLQIDVLRASNSRPVKYSIIMDAQGRVIANRYPSGREQTFNPHSCFRTLGSCEFEFVNPIGDKHRRKYRSVLEDGKFRVEVMNERDHVLWEHQLVFDDAGMMRYLRSSNPRSADKPPYIRRLVAIVEPGGRLPSGVSLSE